MNENQLESTQRASLRKPDLSNSLQYMGVVQSFLVNSSETENGFMMLRFLAQPGSEPPAHVHSNEHEIFYVLEGEIEFYVEGEPASFIAKPGDTMHLPRGAAHGLVFRTPRVSALAMLHAVRGHSTIEPYLKQMAVGPAKSMDLPEGAMEYGTLDAAEMKQAMELAEQYGFRFLSPEETAKRLPSFPGLGARAGAAR